MSEITPYQTEAISGQLLGYAAKYDLQWFGRKRIPSYGLWCVHIKVGRRYPKLPQGYGAVGSKDELLPAVQQFIDDAGIDLRYVRNEGGVRWRLIKHMIVARDCHANPKILGLAGGFGGGNPQDRGTVV
jgi:hypothetical protein